MRWKSELTREHLISSIRNVGAANGAGLAGIIALLPTATAASVQLKVAGGLFLVALVLVGVSWFAILPVDREEKWGASLMAYTLSSAIVLFLIGSVVAYLWAIGIFIQIE